ncbi:MAG: hypothetical protein GEV05_12610 [Betaproteobacteria bacterium]|nr:hypothetical protein [Betaproteobacteria bacterium]
MIRLESTGNLARVDFEGTQTLGGEGEVVFAGSGDLNWVRATEAGTVLTIGEGILVHGTQSGMVGPHDVAAWTPAPQLIVLGRIVADTAGESISLNGGLVRNEGTLQALDGALLQVNNLVNAGTISAGAGGSINVSGDLTSQPGAVTSVLLGGTATTQYGRITISGIARLQGVLSVRNSDGFTPAIGDSFEILTFGSSDGAFSAIGDEDPDDSVTYVWVSTATTLNLNVVPV